MKFLMIGILALTSISSFAGKTYVANGGDRVSIILSNDLGVTSQRSEAKKLIVEKCQDELGGKLVGSIIEVENSGKESISLVQIRNSSVTREVQYFAKEDYVRLASMCVY